MSQPAKLENVDDPNFGFAILVSLAAFAGAVDACGLTVLKDIFVSFMSGNTTLLGAAIADGDLGRAGFIFGLVLLFIAGSAFGTALGAMAGRLRLPAVLLAVAIILVLPPLAPASVVHAMTFAMGALNAAMDHVGSVSVSITYVTGTLVKLGQGLGRRLCGDSNGYDWLEQGLSWLGLLCGAIIGTITVGRAQHVTFSALPIIALALSVLTWMVTRARTTTRST